MTKNKSLIVFLTAILAVGLLGTIVFAQTSGDTRYQVSLVQPTSPVAGDLIKVTVTREEFDTTWSEVAATSDTTVTVHSSTESDKVLGTLVIASGDTQATGWLETAPVTGAADPYTIYATTDTADEDPTTSITVSAAEAAQYTVSAGDVTAGSSSTVSITAEDEYGNTATGYTQEVTVTVTSDLDGQVASAAVSFGSGTGSISTDTGTDGLVTAGEHTLTVDGDFTATATATVSPGTPATMSIAPATDPIESGDSLDLNITGIKDEYGNTVESGSLSTLSVYSDVDGDLTLSNSTPAITDGEATATIDSGSTNLASTGTQTITAYNSNISSVNTTVTVNPIATTMTVDDKMPTSSGDAFTPSATVLDADGSAVPDTGEVSFSYSTQSDITGTLSSADGTVSGDSDFTEDGTTSYSGSFAEQTINGLVYGSSSDSATVSVGGAASSIGITDPGTQEAGSSFDVTATLTDTTSAGTAIEGATLSFSIEGGSSTTATTDASGEATATLTPSESGSQTLTVSFDGGTVNGTFYSNSENTLAVTVNPGPLATVTIEKVENASGLAADEPIESGNAVDLVNVLLKDAEGNPLDSVDESTGIGGLAAETNAQSPVGLTLVDSDPSGYGINDNGYLLDGGDTSITISSDELTAIANHTVSLYVTTGGVTESGTIDVNVTKRSSQFAALASPTVSVGSDFDLSAILERLNSGGSYEAYENASVDVKFQGTTISTTTETDAEGTAGLADTANEDAVFTAPSEPGEYDYTVEFTGDGTTKSATKTDTVTVEAGTVASIEIDEIPANVESGSGFDVTIIGKDSDGNPVTSTPIVDFKVVSDKDGNVFTTQDVLLDDAGKATISVTLDTTGSQELTFYDTSGEFSTTATTNVAAGTTLAIQNPSAGSLLFNEEFEVEAWLTMTSDGSPVTGVDVTLQLWKDPDGNTSASSGSLPDTNVSDDVLVDSATVTTVGKDTNDDGENEVGAATADFLAPYSDDSLYLTAEFTGDSSYYESVDSADSGTGISLAMASAVTDKLSVTPDPAGWNMVSVDGVPSSPTPSDLFSVNTNALFYWDGTGYVQGDNVGDVSPLRGYWYYASNDVAGTDVTDANYDDAYEVGGMVEIELPDANTWYMISAPNDTGWGDVGVSDDGGDTWVSVETAQSELLLNKTLYTYDIADETYLEADAPSGVIKASKGYWVKTGENVPAEGIILGLPFAAPSSPDVNAMSLSEAGFEPVPEGKQTPPAPPAAPQAGNSELKANAAVTSEGVTFEVLGADVQSINVQVFNTNGAEVFSKTASGNSLSWNAGVANGVYLYGVSAKVNGSLKPLGIQKLLILQ